MNTGARALTINTVTTHPRDGVDTVRRKTKRNRKRNRKRNQVMMMMMIAMNFAIVENA